MTWPALWCLEAAGPGVHRITGALFHDGLSFGSLLCKMEARILNRASKYDDEERAPGRHWGKQARGPQGLHQVWASTAFIGPFFQAHGFRPLLFPSLSMFLEHEMVSQELACPQEGLSLDKEQVGCGPLVPHGLSS